MKCPRCNGFMIYEKGATTQSSFYRCLNCGHQRDERYDLNEVAVGQTTQTRRPGMRGWSPAQREAHRRAMRESWDKRRGVDRLAHIMNGKAKGRSVEGLVDAARLPVPAKYDQYGSLIKELEARREAINQALDALKRLQVDRTLQTA